MVSVWVFLMDTSVPSDSTLNRFIGFFYHKTIVPNLCIVGQCRAVETQMGRCHTARRLGTACGLSGFLAIVIAAYGGRPDGPGVIVVLLVAFVGRLGDIMGVGTPGNAKGFQELVNRLDTCGRLLAVPYAVPHIRVASRVGIFVTFVGHCIQIASLPA